MSRRRLPRPSLFDALIAAAFVSATIAEALVSETTRTPAVHALIAGPAMATLAWRRHFPLAVAALVVLANFAINPDGDFTTLLAIVLVAYSIGAETEPPRSWLGLAMMAVPLVGVFVPGAPERLYDTRPDRPRVIQSCGVFAGRDGVLYVTDYNAGLYVLQYEPGST